MTIKASISLVWAVTSLTFISTAHAQPDFDPQTEVKTIADAYLMPAGKDAQDAINLATSDPKKACDLAKHASLSVTTADQQLISLHDKLIQNDYDPSTLQPIQDKVKASVQQMAALSQAICSGEIANVQSAPGTRDMTQKIGGYMSAYTDDVSAILKAQEANDTTTICARAHDGDTQLRDLSAYLVDLRKTTSFSQTDLTALDSLNEKIAGFKAQNDARLTKCQ
jgi:hypothetical protein